MSCLLIKINIILKWIIVLSLALWYSSICFGQKVSISIEGGYQLKSALSSPRTTWELNSDGSNEIYKFSFGEGILLGTTIMYHLKPNWQIGLKANYILSNLENAPASSDYKSEMFRFIPQTKFYWRKGKWSAFGSIGLIVGRGKFKQSYQRFDVNTSSGIKDIYRVNEYTGGFSFGVNNSIGIEYEANSKINWYLMLDNYTQSYGPRQREILQYEVDGIDRLEDISESGRIQKYEDFLTWEELSITATDNKEIRIFYPYSSLGLSLGITIPLIKESKR